MGAAVAAGMLLAGLGIEAMPQRLAFKPFDVRQVGDDLRLLLRPA